MQFAIHLTSSHVKKMLKFLTKTTKLLKYISNAHTLKNKINEINVDKLQWKLTIKSDEHGSRIKSSRSRLMTKEHHLAPHFTNSQDSLHLISNDYELIFFYQILLFYHHRFLCNNQFKPWTQCIDVTWKCRSNGCLAS